MRRGRPRPGHGRHQRRPAAGRRRGRGGTPAAPARLRRHPQPGRGGDAAAASRWPRRWRRWSPRRTGSGRPAPRGCCSRVATCRAATRRSTCSSARTACGSLRRAPHRHHQHPRHRLQPVLGPGGPAPAAPGLGGDRAGRKTWLTGALAGRGQPRGRPGPRPGAPLPRASGAPRDRSATEMWEATAVLRKAIDDLPFLARPGRRHAAPRDRSPYYLAQDAHYLADYGRVLAAGGRPGGHRRRSAAVGRQRPQPPWPSSASCTSATSATSGRGSGRPPARRTRSYLLSLTTLGCYPVLVAGVLPCFWIYDDVGRRLRARSAT